MRTHFVSAWLLVAISSLGFASKKHNLKNNQLHKNLKGRQDAPVVSPDGSCGIVVSGTYTCKGSAFGPCCGYDGRCGSDSYYCAPTSGCLPAFGICDSPMAMSPAPVPQATAAVNAPFPIRNTTSSTTSISLGPGPVVPSIGDGGRNGTLTPVYNGTIATTSPTGTLPDPGNGGRTGTQTFTSPTMIGSGGGGSGGMTTATSSAPGSGNRSGFIGTVPAGPGSVCSVFTRVVPIG